jgi:hypothetical protein
MNDCCQSYCTDWTNSCSTRDGKTDRPTLAKVYLEGE